MDEDVKTQLKHGRFYTALMSKLRNELAEYKADFLECSESIALLEDKRYALIVTLYDLALREPLEEATAEILLNVDSVLLSCWDLWYEKGYPISKLYEELARCYMEGEVW